MAYADSEDFRAVWDTDKSDARLEAWLERASRVLRDEMGGLLDPVDEGQLATLRDVCIDMVHRADASPLAGLGVESYSQGANGFTENVGLQNPMGDLYLTKQERLRLGMGDQQVGCYVPIDQTEVTDA